MGTQLQHGFTIRIFFFIAVFLPALLFTVASGIKLISNSTASTEARRKTRITFFLAGFATIVILIAILYGRSCSGIECTIPPF